jgi:hypothetical protein
MSRKRYTVEQIIGLLRELDVKVSQGKNVGQICREIAIAELTLDKLILKEALEGNY